MGNLSITYVDTSSIKPYARNARNHPRRQVNLIAAAMQEFGFTNPIITDENGEIIAGHGRLQAAKQLGLTTIPTVQIGHLSRTQKRALRLADNRLAEKAGWDLEILAVELQDLQADGFEVELTGFETSYIDVILDAAANKKSDRHGDDNIPAAGPAVTQAGDLWQLGAHRIFCGNALEGTSYDNLLDGRKASLIFTDPPYNVTIGGNVGGKGEIHHREFAMGSGEMTPAAFTGFLKKLFSSLWPIAETAPSTTRAWTGVTCRKFLRRDIRSTRSLRTFASGTSPTAAWALFTAPSTAGVRLEIGNSASRE